MSVLDPEDQQQITQELSLQEMVQQLLETADKCLSAAATLAVISGEEPAPGSVLDKLLGVTESQTQTPVWLPFMGTTAVYNNVTMASNNTSGGSNGH